MKKIVHIEDNNVVRKFVKNTLKDTNFEYLGFRTAEEALNTIRAGVDLLLLDLKLTGDMQGRDLLDLMNKEGIKIKVIAVTAAPDETEGDLLEAYPDLVVKTIFKPFEPDDLLELIRNALGLEE